jgi:hypothetical protein
MRKEAGGPNFRHYEGIGLEGFGKVAPAANRVRSFCVSADIRTNRYQLERDSEVIPLEVSAFCASLIWGVARIMFFSRRKRQYWRDNVDDMFIMICPYSMNSTIHYLMRDAQSPLNSRAASCWWQVTADTWLRVPCLSLSWFKHGDPIKAWQCQDWSWRWHDKTQIIALEGETGWTLCPASRDDSGEDCTGNSALDGKAVEICTCIREVRGSNLGRQQVSWRRCSVVLFCSSRETPEYSLRHAFTISHSLT